MVPQTLNPSAPALHDPDKPRADGKLVAPVKWLTAEIVEEVRKNETLLDMLDVYVATNSTLPS